MPDDLRISADELRKRIETGEEFTIIDVRNPNAWAAATDKAGNAIRVTLDNADAILPHIPREKPIATYCT